MAAIEVREGPGRTPRDELGHPIPGGTTCASCGAPAVPATGFGRCLELVANGRTLCVGCGRFQVHCECRR